jgi:flagellum-specific peptidoglycan hydrolase FlgJ
MMVNLSILVAMFLFTGRAESVKPYVASYIEEHKYMAIDEMITSGIPASITLAQAIVESNAGLSGLARETNNHFGIKCKEYWKGANYYHPDDERDQQGNLIPSCFRKYDSVTASYQDHSDFLMTTEHYKALFTFDKTDYESWAMGLEICGYASDEGYADKLIRTIRLYNLHELDYYTIEYVKKDQLSPK